MPLRTSVTDNYPVGASQSHSTSYKLQNFTSVIHQS